jgi:hypothetical protein
VADDLLRIVELSDGGRPVLVRELNDGSAALLGKNTLALSPPGRSSILSSGPGRFSGSRVVGERQGNAQLAFTLAAKGASEDACLAEADRLVADISDDAQGRLVEFRARGVTRSTFYDVRGPADWKPLIDLTLLGQQHALAIEVGFPIAPLALGLPMDIYDDFSLPPDAELVRTNLVTNPSFEVDTAGWSYYSPGSEIPQTTFVRVTDWAEVGGASLSVAATSPDPVPGGSAEMGALSTTGTGGMPVTTGLSYTLISQVNISAGAAGAGGIRQRVYWYDSGGASVGTSTGAVVDDTGGGEFALSDTFTAPALAAFAAVYIHHYTETASDVMAFKLDAVKFAQESSPTLYFDGDSDKARWTGTTHASTSELYDRSTLEDYSFDAGSGTLGAGGGQLVPSSTAEKRFGHSARGYEYEDVQIQIKHTTPSSMGSIYEVYAILKRLDGSNYLRVGLFNDNGANHSVTIDRYDAGVPTNLAADGTLASFATSTSFWLRARIEGDVITVEHFTSEPGPMSTPIKTTTHTLTGAAKTKFGAGISGDAWVRWNPFHTSARLDDLKVEPFTYRNQTLPKQIVLGGAIPGSAPASCELHLGRAAGGSAPVFALVGWNGRPVSPLSGARVPFGRWDASDGVADLSGWAVSGSAIADATPTAAETYAASWVIDPGTLAPDEFSDELLIDFYALVRLSSQLVTPRLILSARPDPGTGFGGERFTVEHGSRGQLLTVPSSGDAYRTVRLGSIAFPARQAKHKLWLAGTLGAGSAGSVWSVERLYAVPARRRASSPTGEPNDSSYPRFLNTSAEARKLILAGGQGRTAQATGPYFEDSGLSRGIELAPGLNDLFLALATRPPDDPTADAVSESTSEAATVHLALTPRYRLFGG